MRLENTSRKLRLTTTIICSSSPSSRCTLQSPDSSFTPCAVPTPLSAPSPTYLSRPFSNQTWTPPLPRLASSNHPRPPHPPPPSSPPRYDITPRGTLWGFPPPPFRLFPEPSPLARADFASSPPRRTPASRAFHGRRGSLVSCRHHCRTAPRLRGLRRSVERG
ncbi:hypothetical protein ALC53_00460 [Atta colombica]|uniref:Uncharacterized protein n=1 Tax=Atta colombica TaxID=520822 RepID=A0A195BWG1_9HYME|nr:hypothetical protein ALC53_00460 [Atta colombica]